MEMLMYFVHQYMAFVKANPVVGGVIGLWGVTTLSVFARYLPAMIRAIILKQFTMTVTIHNQDDLFYNFIDWFERAGFSKKSRTLRAMAGQSRVTGPRVSIGYGGHYFWHGWRLFRAVRLQELSQQSFVKETITISTLGRTQKSIRAMLNQCVPHQSEDSTRIFIYQGFWNQVNEQPSRTMETIFVPQKVKDDLTVMLNKFLANRPFYDKNGIPYRLGLALHGLPGTGKTSMVRALCHYLKRDLYVMDLAKLDNEKLMDAFNTVPSRCLMLIEDIDTYDHCTKRVTKKKIDAPTDKSVVKAVQELSGITLSGILNAVDGVISTSDRILIVTTNHFEKLDPALKRRGRIDYDVWFGHLNDETFRAMMERAYPEFNVPRTFKVPANLAPVDLQSMILAHQDDPKEMIKVLQARRKK